MNFDNFMLLDPSVREIVNDWFHHARQHPNVMQRFINLWMSFNGWATCVTEKDIDRAMVEMLIDDPRMRNAFDTLYDRDGAFNGIVGRFVEWWPIYDARDFRRKARQSKVNDIYSREDVHRYAQQWGVKREPRNWLPGSRVTWGDVLWAIYKVRCNLFHGQKGMNNPSDVRLVEIAHEVLERFIRETGCYEWN